MNRDDLKHYMEELALKTLIEFVDESFSTLERDDMPDLQSINSKEWGIEVTESKKKYDGKSEKFLRDYFGKEKNLEILTMEAKNMGLDPWMGMTEEGMLFYSSHKKPMDLNIKKKNVAVDIDKKSEKSEEYKKFNNNGLYLFCCWPFIEDDIKDIIKMITKNTFSHLFFDCKNCIFVYECSSKSLTKYEINQEKYGKLLDKLNSIYKLY